MKWFNIYWYQYLFEAPKHSRSDYCNWFQRMICRAQGHPGGAGWYKSGYMGPDSHCDNCGDELG